MTTYKLPEWMFTTTWRECGMAGDGSLFLAPVDGSDDEDLWPTTVRIARRHLEEADDGR